MMCMWHRRSVLHRCCVCGGEESLRILLEFSGAAFGTEVVGLAVEFDGSGGFRWIDGHAADWVFCDFCCCVCVFHFLFRDFLSRKFPCAVGSCTISSAKVRVDGF